MPCGSPRRHLGLLLLAATTSVALAGCTAATATRQPAEAPTTNTQSTAPAAWPAFGPCPPTSIQALPSGSGCASRVVGDFDGDGSADRFVVYAHPLADDGTAKAWHVMLLLATGQVRAADLSMDPGSDNKGVVAAFDANGDGRDEALVLVHQGAADDFSRLFSLRDTRILQVRDENNRPFEFDVGSVASFGSGGGCRRVDGTTMLVTSGYVERGQTWHWSRTFYRWNGDRGLHVSRAYTDDGSTTERAAGRYARFDCLSVHLGATTRPKAVF
jgi:hypothetical protein